MVNGRQAVRVTIGAIAALCLALIVMSSSASAQEPIDDETVVLINAHRASKGVPPLIKDPVLTQAAIDWSAIMQAGSPAGADCGLTPGGALDAGAAFRSPDATPTVPTGASHITDFVNYSCTPKTTTAAFNWNDPAALPTYCINMLSQASAEYLTCWLLSDPTQRAALERADQTHIGVGVGSKAKDLTGGAHELYSTVRLAGNVPLPMPPAPVPFAPAIAYTGPFTNVPHAPQAAYGFGAISPVSGTPVGAVVVAAQAPAPTSPGLAATGATSGPVFAFGLLLFGLGAWTVASGRVIRSSQR